MKPAIRTIREHGERWLSEADLRRAMNDDELITQAAAMLKVAHEKGDSPIEAVRRCVAYFYTQATAALQHHGN